MALLEPMKGDEHSDLSPLTRETPQVAPVRGEHRSLRAVMDGSCRAEMHFFWLGGVGRPFRGAGAIRRRFKDHRAQRALNITKWCDIGPNNQ